jgi:hypothetical protein
MESPTPFQDHACQHSSKKKILSASIQIHMQMNFFDLMPLPPTGAASACCFLASFHPDIRAPEEIQ